MPDSESLLDRLDKQTAALDRLTQAINALAKSNAQIADALLAETDQGTLDDPTTL